MTRVTGISLYFGGFALAAAALYDTELLVNVLTSLRSDYWLLVPLAKFAISFPLAYHFLFGLRHLFWDWTSRGLDEMDNVYFWSRVLLVGSLVVALIYTFLRF